MVAVVDYKAGNIRSVLFAMERLGEKAILTSNNDIIKSADKVIIPGQGEASTTMQNLRDRGLDLLIPTLTQPVLGICVGMQLFCEYSEENNTQCLGIFPHKVLKFKPLDNTTKVPQVGWNTISQVKNGIFTKDLEGKYVYFVHSYYVEIGLYTTATTDYIQPYSAAIQKDNFYATQFHPEKSGDVGEAILKNFLKIKI